MSMWRGQCDARPMGYLLSHKTGKVTIVNHSNCNNHSKPIWYHPSGWYQIILLGDRGMCVNNLHRVAMDSREARIQTCNLLITSKLLGHQATYIRTS